MWSNIHSPGPVKSNWKNKAFLRYLIWRCVSKALVCKVIETWLDNSRLREGKGGRGCWFRKSKKEVNNLMMGKTRMQLSLWNNGNQELESCQGSFSIWNLCFSNMLPLLCVDQSSLPGGHLTIHDSFFFPFFFFFNCTFFFFPRERQSLFF